MVHFLACSEAWIPVPITVAFELLLFELEAGCVKASGVSILVIMAGDGGFWLVRGFAGLLFVLALASNQPLPRNLPSNPEHPEFSVLARRQQPDDSTKAAGLGLSWVGVVRVLSFGLPLYVQLLTVVNQ